MIAIPIAASTKHDALRDLERAEKMADCIEIRLDLLPREAWVPLLRRKRKPSIVALRPERQGGSFQGEEISRTHLLEEALGYDPDFIDVEWDTPPHLIGSLLRKKGASTRVIVSYHNFAETPHDLRTILKKMASWDGNILKVVTLANDFVDNVRILRLLEGRAEKTIAFCMGSFGLPSRILTLRAGGYLTFGALEEGKESAPGQIPARDLKGIYRAHQIHRGTRVFGVIGNPVSHSVSPNIHNAAFAAVGYDAVYVPFQVRDFGNLIHDLASIGVEGFSVTIPHKERIIPVLGNVDEKSRRMGAVNTVYRQSGEWFGTNTDVYGAWKALQAACRDLQEKRWTILGAGGVARAIAAGAEMYGQPKSLTVLGRTRKRLDHFLADFRKISSCPIGGVVIGEADFGKILEETDILVNGTPVGMVPEVDENLIPSDLLRPRHLVFDTIYNPMETRLLREARKQGCRTVSGFQMFLHQGAAQFERWTGKNAPLALMEQTARGCLQGEETDN
ncbi:MAG: shikimate dehydrogenase [Proteobacteria bacterium]|nr:shikimate dehydrogenase [Pseudomonadota bacterium]NIS72353.1 shikimate dehydrogenase [Pseudomonadota bacterium]